MPNVNSYPDASLSQVNGATNIQFLVDLDSTTYNITRDVLKQALGAVIVENVQAGTAYTLQTTDQQQLVRMTNVGTKTVTLPPTAGFRAGEGIAIRNAGAGNLSLALGSGVTANGGGTILVQHASCVVVPRGTDEWDIYGDVSGTVAGSTDTTPPTFISASVEDANKNKIVITYSEALDTASIPANAAFNASGGKTVTGVAIAGVTVTLTVDSNYAAGDVITFDYTVPVSNKIKDLAGNAAAGLVTQAVTNNIVGSGANFATYGWSSWHTPRLNTVTSGGFVDYIRDQKKLALPFPPTSNDLLQLTSANRPSYIASGINGLPCFQIGPSLYLESTADAGLAKADEFTRIYCFKVNSLDLSAARYLDLSNQQFNLAINTTGKLAFGNGVGFADSTLTLVTTTAYIIRENVTPSGTSLFASYNGVNDAAILTNSTTPGTLLSTWKLGTELAGNTADVMFCDFFQYDGALNLSDWATMRAQLKTLFGIS